MKKAWLAFRQLTVSAYKDPVWIIATTIFVLLAPRLSFFVDAPFERFSDFEQSLLLRSQDYDREFRMILQVQDNVVAVIQSEEAASEFVHKIARGTATDKKGRRCLELVDKGRLDLVGASGAVEGTHVQNPALARVRDDLKETLRCIDYGLTQMKLICQTRDISKSELLRQELYERSLECLTAEMARGKSHESEFAEVEGELKRELKSETTSLSVLKRRAMLADVAVLYEFGFIQAVVLGWWRRFKGL